MHWNSNSHSLSSYDLIIYLREFNPTTFRDSLQIMILIKIRNVGGLGRNDNGGGVVIGS